MYMWHVRNWCTTIRQAHHLGGITSLSCSAAAPSLVTSNGSGAWVVPVTGVGNTTAEMEPETVEAVISPVSTSSWLMKAGISSVRTRMASCSLGWSEMMFAGMFKCWGSSMLVGVGWTEMMMLGSVTGWATEERDIWAGVIMLPGSIGGKSVKLLITLLEGVESIVIGVGEMLPVFTLFAGMFECWGSSMLVGVAGWTETMMPGSVAGWVTEEGDILAGVMMLPGSIGGKSVALLITLLEGAESIVIGVGEMFPVFACVRGLYIGIVIHLYTPSPPSLVLVLWTILLVVYPRASLGIHHML